MAVERGLLEHQQRLAQTRDIGEARSLCQEEFIPQFASDVTDAEVARQKLDHETVDKIFREWTVSDEEGLIAIGIIGLLDQTLHLEEEADLLRAGLAGLGRIRHVDTNSQLKRADSDQRSPLVSRIHEVQELYEALGLENLVPWTIHGGSIHWSSEVAQDSVATYLILEEEEKAEEVLNRAISDTEKRVGELEPDVDFETSDHELADCYRQWKERRLLIGSWSALGVLKTRKAKKEKDLELMIAGLASIRKAYFYQANPHRLATVSTWTIRAAFNHHFPANIKLRLRAFGQGALSFGNAFADDLKETMRALFCE